MGRPAIAHLGDSGATAERAEVHGVGEVPRELVHVRFLTRGFLLVESWRWLVGKRSA